MNTKIEAQKNRLAVKKARIKIEEQLLKEKERRQRTKKLIQLGALLAKAGIDSFEKEEILGALLEIKAKADRSLRATWKEKGSAIFAAEQAKVSQAIIIRFTEMPSIEIRNKLKEEKFRWNSWRKEWQGFGNREALEKRFENDHAKIETVESSG